MIIIQGVAFILQPNKQHWIIFYRRDFLKSNIQCWQPWTLLVSTQKFQPCSLKVILYAFVNLWEEWRWSFPIKSICSFLNIISQKNYIAAFKNCFNWNSRIIQQQISLPYTISFIIFKRISQLQAFTNRDQRHRISLHHRR